MTALGTLHLVQSFRSASKGFPRVGRKLNARWLGCLSNCLMQMHAASIATNSVEADFPTIQGLSAAINHAKHSSGKCGHEKGLLFRVKLMLERMRKLARY